MTPEERAYRDLWMAELWAPVHEHRQSKDERLDAAERNRRLSTAVHNAGDGRTGDGGTP
jgi:hypothetical protein